MGIGSIVTILILVVSVPIGFVKYSGIFEIPQVPTLEDTWWGPENKGGDDVRIRPFQISVPDEVRNEFIVFQ